MATTKASFTQVFRASAANADNQESDYDSMPELESIQELDSTQNLGENGGLQYTAEGVGNTLLAIFAGYVRGIPSERMDELLSSAIETYRNIPDECAASSFLCDLFVLLFEKRDCRGGEGERVIFHHMLLRLYTEFPHIASKMLELVPEYGCWKDPWEIIEYIRTFDAKKRFENKPANANADDESIASEQDPYEQEEEQLHPNVTAREGLRAREFVSRWPETENSVKLAIQSDFINVGANQFRKDLDALERNVQVSLFAKWAPSERDAFSKRNRYVFKRLVKELSYPNSITPEKDYREAIARLRKKIDIPEAKMCDGRFSEIDPSKTPSVCAFKHRKAFLNLLTEKEADSQGRSASLEEGEQETGNRHPDNPDRVKAREIWLARIKENKIKGGQVDPQSLVRAVDHAQTQDELDFIDAQYVDLREATRAKIVQAKADGFEPMDNIIPMIDMSGSMEGGPMEAAIGLGILLSELNANDFGGLAMIFADDPIILDLNKAKTFSEKVKLIRRQNAGVTTRFHVAMQRIRDIVDDYKIPESQVPSLCVLTDMQYNNHQMGHMKTSEQYIAKLFHDVGMKLSGKPYKKPRTVQWNLRGDTDGFAAKANDQNVQMLAGYSPALFDLILCGKPEPTPYETMRRKLDSSRYDLVRDVFRQATQPAVVQEDEW
jgi:Mg-chelatase subunit ChlD